MANPPTDIEGVDIDIRFTNSAQVTVNEAVTSNSLNSTFTSSYDITYSTSGGDRIVTLDDFDFNNQLNFGSPATLFSIYVFIEGGACTTPTIATNARLFVDGSGFCSVDEINNPGQFCAPQIEVSGEIVTVPVQCNGASNFGLLDAEIKAFPNGSPNESETEDTETDGDYTISNLISGFDYVFRPEKDAVDDCGLNTFDVEKIREHVLDLEFFTNTWEWIAGDANNNGSISTADQIRVQATINGSGTPIYQSWDFAYNYGALTTPSGANIDNVPNFSPDFSINNITTSNTSNDIAGIKIGDVEASCTSCTTSFNNSPVAKNNKTFLIGNPSALENQILRVPVFAKDFSNQIIFSLGLNFLPSTLEVLDIEAGALPDFTESAYSINVAQEGEVSILWFTNQYGGVTLSENEPLFYIVLKAKQNLSSLLGLFEQNFARHENVMHTEGVKEVNRIKIEVKLLPNIGNKPSSVVTTSPNPFKDQFNIEYVLPDASNITIELFDINGKLIKQYQEIGYKGANKLLIKDTDNLPNGLITYKISSQGLNFIGKIVKINQ